MSHPQAPGPRCCCGARFLVLGESHGLVGSPTDVAFAGLGFSPAVSRRQNVEICEVGDGGGRVRD